MKKYIILLFLFISTSTSIQSMNNQPFKSKYNLQKPLKFYNHVLQEMNRRNITKEDVVNVLCTTNLIQKQKHGRVLLKEQSNNSKSLQVILIMTQTKNIVETAFKQCRNSESSNLNQRF